MSEALLFAKHGENMLCEKMSETISVHNMFSPCFAKRRASDKDLPVLKDQGSQKLIEYLRSWEPLTNVKKSWIN